MKHIVFFKLNERNEQNQDALIEILNKMKGQIPFVQDMWVGKDFLNSQRSFDVVLEVTLNKEDLDTYAKDLTQLFGEPTETHENSYFFVSDGKTLVLADPYGDGAYIEISMNH